jgi:hypothetical protein
VWLHGRDAPFAKKCPPSSIRFANCPCYHAQNNTRPVAQIVRRLASLRSPATLVRSPPTAATCTASSRGGDLSGGAGGWREASLTPPTWARRSTTSRRRSYASPPASTTCGAPSSRSPSALAEVVQPAVKAGRPRTRGLSLGPWRSSLLPPSTPTRSSRSHSRRAPHGVRSRPSKLLHRRAGGSASAPSTSPPRTLVFRPPRHSRGFSGKVSCGRSLSQSRSPLCSGAGESAWGP